MAAAQLSGGAPLRAHARLQGTGLEQTIEQGSFYMVCNTSASAESQSLASTGAQGAVCGVCCVVVAAESMFWLSPGAVPLHATPPLSQLTPRARLQPSSSAKSTLRWRARAPTPLPARPLSAASSEPLLRRLPLLFLPCCRCRCCFCPAAAADFAVTHQCRLRGWTLVWGVQLVIRPPPSLCRANSTRVDCATTECACQTDCPGRVPRSPRGPSCCNPDGRQGAACAHVLPLPPAASRQCNSLARWVPCVYADVQGILNGINGKPCSIDCDANGYCKFDIQASKHGAWWGAGIPASLRARLRPGHVSSEPRCCEGSGSPGGAAPCPFPPPRTFLSRWWPPARPPPAWCPASLLWKVGPALATRCQRALLRPELRPCSCPLRSAQPTLRTVLPTGAATATVLPLQAITPSRSPRATTQ